MVEWSASFAWNDPAVWQRTVWSCYPCLCCLLCWSPLALLGGINVRTCSSACIIISSPLWSFLSLFLLICAYLRRMYVLVYVFVMSLTPRRGLCLTLSLWLCFNKAWIIGLKARIFLHECICTSAFLFFLLPFPVSLPRQSEMTSLSMPLDIRTCAAAVCVRCFSGDLTVCSDSCKWWLLLLVGCCV